MSEPFIGQIQPFAFNFAPRGWAKCDGQLLSIASNSALFSLLGTTYGGDGRTTFALPDLRGRASLHVGTGPGLSNRAMGQKGGTENNTMTIAQMPAHTHSVTMRGTETVSTLPKPENNHLGAGQTIYAPAGGTLLNLAADAINQTSQGGGQPQNNMEPYLVINWCIALIGIFPSRN